MGGFVWAKGNESLGIKDLSSKRFVEQIDPKTNRCFEKGRAMMAGDAAAWMLENQLEDLLQMIADEEIKGQVRN